MEKKTSFLSLVYREYCVTKRSVPGTVCACAFIYGICIMFSLSSRFGNVSKIAENSDLSFVKERLPLVARMMGMYISFMIYMLTSDSSSADIKNKTWRYYRKSLPVKPFRLALARTAWQLAGFIVSMLISFVYMGLDGLITGQRVRGSDIFILSAISLLVVFLCTSMTVCVEFAGSVDKGSLMSLGIITALAVAVILPLKSKIRLDAENTSIDELLFMFDRYAVLAPLLLTASIALFAAEAALMTLLYKRREK